MLKNSLAILTKNHSSPSKITLSKSERKEEKNNKQTYICVPDFPLEGGTKFE